MMALKLLVTFFAVMLLLNKANGKNTCSLVTTVLNTQFTNSIQIKHPTTVTFTWEMITGTNNMTIQHTPEISVSSSAKGSKINLDVKAPEKSNSNHFKSQLGIVIALLMLSFCARKFHMVLYISAIVLCLSVVLTASLDCSKPHLHIKFPFKYVDTICVNKEKCFPTKCKLSYSPTSTYSDIPSTNKILFKDKYCTLRKPKFWNEWTLLYFQINSSSEQLYYDDNDKDGLSNIVEYYVGTNLTNTTNQRKRRNTQNVMAIGSNPTNPDTDGDLLTDGFEFGNKMNSKKRDDSNADYDNDGLSNIQEQIRNTDPLNADTDGDGVSDGIEVKNNADPNDPSDGGEKDTSLQTASIRLTIGDPSGSHSERYVILVGDFKHQSPNYGVVGYGTYTFVPGIYPITIQHMGSRYWFPDYDYVANVEKVSGKASINVVDSSGILGYHYESSYDYTVGKRALLNVTANCLQGKSECSCITSCTDCKKMKCVWDKTYCRNKRILEYITKLYFSCPCDSCYDWYKEEKKDTAWLQRLNQEFKCPCRVNMLAYSVTPIDNPSNKVWESDSACKRNGEPWCSFFHKGADGCLRSADVTVDGARQQCCYDSIGKLIKPGLPGAGTPDKSASFLSHTIKDVKSFLICCKVCKQPSYCAYYINGVRKGDDSHCP